MKKLLFPILLVSTSVLAQNRMTTETLWSLKRVGGDGVSPSGKTVYYTSRSYDVQTEKSMAKKYALNLVSGNVRELSSRTIIQKDNDYWYAMDEKAVYRSGDRGDTWQIFYNEVD